MNETVALRLDYLYGNTSNLRAVFPYPTGSGKSYIFETVAVVTEEPTLFIVPRDTLLTQTINGLNSVAKSLNKNVEDKVTVLKSKHHGHLTKSKCTKILKSHTYLFSTYQTMILNINNFPWDQLASVVFDEGHHALSATWQDAIGIIKNHSNLSLNFYTASPYRGVANIRRKKKKDESKSDSNIPQQKLVGSCFELAGYSDEHENPITPLSITEAIDEGINCPVVTVRVKPKLSQNFVPIASTDPSKEISEKRVANSIDKQEYNQIPVDIYCNVRDPKSGKPIRGQKAVVNVARIQQAINVAEEFNRISIDAVDPTHSLRNAFLARYRKEYPNDHKSDKEVLATFCIAKAIHSDNLDHKECQHIIDQFRLGGILVLIGADKLTEGFDDPAVSVIINMRPTRSEVINTQRTGRGVRVNLNDPFKTCTVFEFDWEMPNQLSFNKYLVSKEGFVSSCWGDVELNRRAYLPSAMQVIRVFSEESSGSVYEPNYTLDWDWSDLIDTEQFDYTMQDHFSPYTGYYSTFDFGDSKPSRESTGIFTQAPLNTKSGILFGTQSTVPTLFNSQTPINPIWFELTQETDLSYETYGIRPKM